jgi:photosystem II stability/assembly factor-like uncharacterized protein
MRPAFYGAHQSNFQTDAMQAYQPHLCNTTPLSLTALLWVMFSASGCLFPSEKTPTATRVPNDYLWAQRAFPYDSVPSAPYYDALNQVQHAVAQRSDVVLDWQAAGPTNVGGRITDVAMHHSDQQTMYAATASGGVWKSINSGASWQPITDALPSLSIGDIAIDPSDKNTLYCGTGEPNAGGGSVTYDGRGVFKSVDGGNTWQAAGLQATGSIGRIEVDPERPERVFVAAQGRLFGNNSERGLYRSKNGGQSWEQVLFLNDSTGVIDLAIHPDNPDTIFAVSWERIRRPNKRVYGGSASGIWRSVDGGDNWTRLTNGLPTTSNTGRIGIAIAPSSPNILWATIANTNGQFFGVYKSTNHGDSWTALPANTGNPGYFSFGWWFGQIRVHPQQPDHVFNLGVDWLETPDNGTNWLDASPYLHADYHAFYIHPANTNLRLVGNDGGIYLSNNGGTTWSHRPLPITQFYTCEINFQQPALFSGGAQDNGTQASIAGALNDWQEINGGDGFVTLVNPLDPTLVYATSQYGGFNGSNGATAPLAMRYNWNAPYIFDPNNPDILYFGAERLFQSVDAGLNWLPISPDLSNGITGSGGVVYATITTIAASALDAGVLLAGTDDGNVWATNDGGNVWKKVSASLPRRWITKVVTDPWDAQTAYVCLSGFRHDENLAHVYKTTDLGNTWVAVSGDLPDVPVNDLILDPLYPNVWYLATDAGVFTTTNGGAHWSAANTGFPLVPVLDLTFHAPTRTLLAASYGRSMFWAKAQFTSGLPAPASVANVVVTPNPSTDRWCISVHLTVAQRVTMGLYHQSGALLRSYPETALPAGHSVQEVACAELPAGVYYWKITSETGSTVVKKLVRG